MRLLVPYIALGVAACSGSAQERHELAVVSSVHHLSHRQAVFEDDGTVAYLYLISPRKEGTQPEIERICWVYNRIPAPEPDDAERYLPNPPPAPVGFTDSEPRQHPPDLEDVYFQWSADGESAALLFGDRVVAYVSSRVSDEMRKRNTRSWHVQHGSVSRDLSNAGPFGVPWDENDFQNTFRDAEKPHPASRMPDSSSEGISAKRGAGAGVRLVEATDKEMDAAIEEAKASLDSFIELVERPKPGQSRFALKIGLHEGEVIEHIWLGDLSIAGGSVSGTILNEPQYLPGYSLGQRVVTTADNVSDWMYIEDGVLRGGYTLRLFRARMSAEERAALDADLDYEID